MSVFVEAETQSTIILNVDDYEVGRYTRGRVLRRAGYTVIEAATGAEALRLIAAERPALVLLDINLPDIGGLEVCRQVKSDRALRSTIILQVSASATAVQDQVMGLDIGADGYLIDPVDPGVLLATVRSLLRLHRTEHQLSDARDYAESIVDTIREPLLVLDSSLKVRSANRSFYSIFRVRPENTENRLLYELGTGEWNIPELRQLLEDVLPQQESFENFPVELNLPATGVSTLLLNARKIWRETNHTELILLTFEDITERKQAEEALLRWNQELQYFTQAASHDLREPLRMIVSFGQLLEKCCKDELPADGRQHLEFVLDGARRMQVLLEDMLAYARQAGFEELPLQSASSESALKAALANMNLTIQEHRADIKWGALPVVKANPEQLAQVFQNLVGNAIKYRSAEAPIIRIEVAQRTDGWLFSIRDNGIGFPQEDAERIFLPFKRLHGRKIPGTGIGLSLCKHIVERHGGRIWAESEEGQGAIFNFTLPDST